MSGRIGPLSAARPVGASGVLWTLVEGVGVIAVKGLALRLGRVQRVELPGCGRDGAAHGEAALVGEHQGSFALGF